MQLHFTPEQEQKLHDISAKAQHKAEQVSQKAQEIAHDVKQRAEDLAHKASEKISEIHPQEIVRDAGALIKKHPMQSLAVGAVVGGLIGALFARRARRA
ncbi:hypothetical protein ABS71_02745 [bacterium SCN 62-11]|nr:DUF883 family protein [Candidatus Eremiobacteraeota bacterium]ODT77128.1 MAG: hypothetical protein ABS71_02745 [bacterium SCN 62-11]